MAFALAVFDVAGTVVLDGDAVVVSMQAAMARQGIDVAQTDVVSVMGLPKPVAIATLLSARGLPSDDGRVALERAIHEDFRADIKARYRAGDGIRPADGAPTVFEALRQAGIRVALDTGFTRDVLDALLERLGWRESHTFDVSLASDEVVRGRPFPDLIHHAMRRLQVTDPARVAKVGDTPADLEEGRAARCGLVVGVTYGTHTAAQLAAADVHLVNSLPELLPLLGVASA